jgi:hypothetical protein
VNLYAKERKNFKNALISEVSGGGLPTFQAAVSTLISI